MSRDTNDLCGVGYGIVNNLTVSAGHSYFIISMSGMV